MLISQNLTHHRSEPFKAEELRAMLPDDFGVDNIIKDKTITGSMTKCRKIGKQNFMTY
ncbi:hypothetical protein [Clostridium sp.]|uniref:hypothetical protein n=1 Tax=Clostridium sp. TaxID=1506 RepID=UPI00285104EB|nr:hypothetical protein [Clostridium sp.]MDR3594163.1 hypothetical protein [Clostridium sp.]